MSDLDTFIEEQGLADEVAALEAEDVVPLEGCGTTGTSAEEDDTPDKWTRVPSRQQMRDMFFRRGEIQPGRSRIRRKYHRIARQKGAWQ